MREDAVAPVVAAMLILAVVVTFFAAWNAILIPSLKQQDEMTHLRSVEGAFNRFSSDISTAVSLKQDMTLSESLSLGGGGVLFNSLMSAGTLRVGEEPRFLYRVNITDNGIDRRVTESRLVNFSYRPVGNFWLDQGYAWHYGYVNVTKGSSSTGPDGAALSTPLSYPTMDNVKKSASIHTFAGSLITIEARPWYNSSANCSHITITPVTFSTEHGASYVSSNGIGTLALTSVVNETQYGVAETKSPDMLVIRITNSSAVPDPFPLELYTRCNRTFANLNATYPSNIAHVFRTTKLFNETGIEPIRGSLPFDITLRQVSVNVSVY
jgi:hypothetical protein